MLHPQTLLNNAPQPMRHVAIISANKILDCKQFVKNYHPGNKLQADEPPAVHLTCEVELMEESEEDYATDPLPPELLVLSPNATVSDLKLEASKAFQEVYLILRKFEAVELVGYGGVEESTQVKLLLGGGGSTETVRMRGRCLGKNGLLLLSSSRRKFRMERGVERWTVDCSCGAKDDDGERMLACDVCGIWQHTRCAGIPDMDAVPARFLCYRCCSNRASSEAQISGLCNEDTTTVGSVAIASGGRATNAV